MKQTLFCMSANGKHKQKFSQDREFEFHISEMKWIIHLNNIYRINQKIYINQVEPLKTEDFIKVEIQVHLYGGISLLQEIYSIYME